MRDYIELGYVPKEESAEKSRTFGNKVQAHTYCAQLQRHFPDLVFVTAKTNYGEYYVEVVFDDEDEKACNQANMVACGLSYWDEQALEALALKGFPAR